MATIAPPPKPTNPVLIDSEGYIDQQISRTRRSLKLLDLAAGVMTLMIGLLGFILVGAVIDQWIVPGGLGTFGRVSLFAVMLLGVVWYGWRQFVPLLKPINPVYAAQTIERNAPTLKNSLLNLILFRSHRDYLSARVYHALEQQAAQRLSTSALEASIDRSALLRLGYALVLIVAVCALYAVLSPKNLALSAARVMAPWTDLTAPSRVQILDVKPGKASVARGERVEVSAEINGLDAEELPRLRYSTADERIVGESIRMERTSPQSRRFQAFLPRGTDAGVEQDLSYWIEAGDARSRKYKLSVFTRPTMTVQKVRYEYPAYTGIPSKETDHTGDIRGVEGTKVTISALASQPIKTAHVDLKADGTKDLDMTADGDRANASFVLKLRDDRRTPVDPKYMLRFTSVDGRTNSDPATHAIEVTPDYAPEVRITEPEAPEQVVRVGEIVPIGVEARDPDYALSSVNIVGKIDGGEEQTLIEMISEPHTGKLDAKRMFTPSDIGMKPGQVLEYWAEARDNRPEPNIAFSEHRRLKVIGPDKPPQGKQPPQGQGKQQPDGKEPGEEGGGGQGGGMAGGNDGESGGSSEGEQSGAGGSAGGEGESGEESKDSQGANGQSGGSNDSGESNEGDSEQSGESGAGGASGAGSDDANEQTQDNGEQGNRPGGSGQQGAQKEPSSDAESESGESGEAGASGESQDGSSGEGGKVSSAGDNDGEAFQKLSEMLNPDGQNQSGGGKPGEQQPEGAQQNQAGEASGQNAEGDQQTNGQAGAQQQKNGQAGQQQAGAEAGESQTGESGQEGEAGENGQTPPDTATGNAKASQKVTGQQSPAAGAQPQGAGEQAGDAEQQTAPAGDNPSKREGADEAREAKPGDGNPDDPQQGDQPSPDGTMNQDNGNSGAGHSTGEEQGTPDSAMRQGKDKQEGDNRQAEDDQEAPVGSPDKKESDSEGGQGGEQSGGGQEGAGQQADAAGKGGAGQHEAADQGAGRAEEQGEGETGAKAGDQQMADGKTGQSSGDQAGQGSQQGDAGEQKSQDLSGEQGQPEGAQASEGGQPGSQEGKPGEQNGAEQSPEGKPGEQGGQESGQGKSPQGQPGEAPAAGEQPSPNASPNGDQQSDKPSDQKPSTQSSNGSAQPMGGGTGSNAQSSSSAPVELEEADKANLDYARQQTDLVLERLDAQLAKKQVDPKLLKSLGWTEAELQRFVDRWKDLKSRAEGTGDDAAEASQELDDSLRSLGLRRAEPLRMRGTAKADDLRANDALRTKAPSEYADRVREYSKAISSQGDSSQDDE